MNDDDASRSSGAPVPAQPLPRMTSAAAPRGPRARAAQRLLRRGGVRARARAPGAPREGGRAGQAAAPRSRSTISDDLSRYLSACQLGITLTSLGIGFLGEPAIAPICRAVFGDEHLARLVAGDLARARLPDHDRAAHHDRRAGPEDLRDPEGRAGRAARRAAAVHLHARLPPVHPAAQRRVERDPAPASASSTSGSLEDGRDARGAQGADPAVADRRQARPGRGGDAHRRLPPARAGGAPGDDAGAGRRDRRPLRGRRDRAAALRLLRPHAAASSPRTRTTTA